jgi:hypothetical protein
MKDSERYRQYCNLQEGYGVWQGYFDESDFRALCHALYSHHFNKGKAKQIIAATSLSKDGRFDKKMNN